jgi:hypothetical protein
MLLRLAYPGITNAFALLRRLPGSDRDEDVEILALRHQLAGLQHQLDGQRIRFQSADRTWLAALLHDLPRPCTAPKPILALLSFCFVAVGMRRGGTR